MSIGKSVGGFGEFLSSIRLSGTYNNLKQDYRNITSKNKFGQMIFNISKRVKDFVKHGLIDDTIFEDFGVDYLGPVNGHDFEDLIRVLNLAKKSKSSVVIHVVTKKVEGINMLKTILKVIGMASHLLILLMVQLKHRHLRIKLAGQKWLLIILN